MKKGFKKKGENYKDLKRNEIILIFRFGFFILSGFEVLSLLK